MKEKEVKPQEGKMFVGFERGGGREHSADLKPHK